MDNKYFYVYSKVNKLKAVKFKRSYRRNHEKFCIPEIRVCKSRQLKLLYTSVIWWWGLVVVFSYFSIVIDNAVSTAFLVDFAIYVWGVVELGVWFAVEFLPVANSVAT